MYHPIDRIAHTTAFITPVAKHWLEREIAQWVHHEGSIRRPNAPRANALTTVLHLAPEGNALFNDALNTFYLRLYSVGHMVKDHSAIDETLCHHTGYSFRLAVRVIVYALSYNRIAHTTAYITPVVEYWLERKIAQWITMWD